MDRILPPGVVLVERSDDVSIDTVWPGELGPVSSASISRQMEYATVRSCARAALTTLGVGEAAILQDPKGCPLWPDHVVGSMTHCRGFRAAAVARTELVRTLGIDAEPAQSLPEGVLTRITTPQERTSIESLVAQSPETPWDKVLFSLKESLYKAWYPLTHTPLEFREATVHLHPNGHCDLHVTRPVPPEIPPPTWQARWCLSDGFVATAVWVPT